MAVLPFCRAKTRSAPACPDIYRRVVCVLLFTATAWADLSPFVSRTQPYATWALPVQIRTAPAFDAIMLRMQGSYNQHISALNQLRAELRRMGVNPVGDPFGRYINDPARTPEQDLRWEVGFPVPPGARPSPPFELRHFEARLVASLQVHGPYLENSLRWPAFYEWLAARGYQTTDPSIEAWSVSSTPDGFYTGQSELQVPVRRVPIVPLLFRYVVYLWGSCVFAMFSWFYLRQSQHRKLSLWSGPLWALLSLACVVLYFQPLLSEFIYLYSAMALLIFHAWSAAVAGIVIPPLLVHLFFRITRPALPAARGFRWSVAAMYSISAAIVVSLRLNHNFWTPVDRTLHIGNGFIALAAAICLAMVLLAHTGRTDSTRDSERRAYIGLLAATIAVSLTGAMVSGETSRGLSDAALRILPMFFVFAAMYYNERTIFFDIIAKRGLFLLGALVLLTLYFALIPSWLFSVRLGWIGLWVYPLSALPLIVTAPWAYGRLSFYLDRYWLGRTLPPQEAHQFLLAGLGTATTEEALVQAAEQCLTSIYHASVRITLGADAPVHDSNTEIFQMPIRAGGEQLGFVQLRNLTDRRPLLSEDRKQLASLVDSFALMLENLRLREKRLQQERREQALRLQTSRAELRALRAQINPHFLFNALNSIAALIASDPEQAEATVERLSELFRYTLRNWDGEWVRLDQEMAFVRCYLDVEKTRFKRRLSVSFEQDQEAGEALVPALMVQTLVENAIKHGVAPTRGPSKVEVCIQRSNGTLRIEVRDSGPGFQDNSSPAGHGLKNTRDRLREHFGNNAQLTIARDEASAITKVNIVMPVLLVPPRDQQGTV